MLVLNKCIFAQHLLVTHDMVFVKNVTVKPCYGEKLKLVKQLVQLQPNLSVNQVQLTMRTFHTGVAGSDITQGLPRIQEIFEARNLKVKR